ncbi:PEP-CTERM sorting domain-containing protein [Alteromonas sp. M12]|uniref:PEP-CTERM sorting domain-containing protein n=1 Tax=Alteromonas sp. M12 TaxID=3135644 RepID=UPI00319DC527
MKFKNFSVAVLMYIFYSQSSFAGLIEGPELTQNNTGWTNNGISFTALQDSTLTSFVYNNQGLADTVLLVDELGGILQSIDIAAGNTEQLINVSWALMAGDIYGLLATQEYGDNGRWVNTSYPVANTDISVNGYAKNGLGSVVGTDHWFHFTDIATNEGSEIPEPTSIAILGLGLSFFAFRRNRKDLNFK